MRATTSTCWPVRLAPAATYGPPWQTPASTWGGPGNSNDHADHSSGGGVVRLWPNAAVTQGLLVAEGLETTLRAARVRAGLVLSGRGNLELLPVLSGIRCLTIIADHDPAGLRAAQECRERWLAAEVEVRSWQAPSKGDDFNDFARGPTC